MFSMKPIFVKIAYQYDVDATTLMTLRMVFSLPFFIVFGFMALKQRRASHLETDFSKPTLIKAAATGVLGYYLASWFDLEGLTYITAHFERLILFTFPVLVAILNYFIFKIKLPRTAILPMVLTYVGLAIIFAHDLVSFGDNVIIGTILVFSAAVFFSLYFVFSKPLITRLGSRLFTCVAMSAASIMIILHFLIVKDLSDLLVQKEVFYTAIAIALLTTVIPVFLINEAIARLGSQKTSNVGTIGPVITTVVAGYVLGEEFSIYHAAGMALVILGIYLLGNKSDKK
jgi:drug/metabolite transporter (DMT)-like permease